MTYLTQKQAKQAAAELSGWKGPFTIKRDTSDFFRIQASDIVLLDNTYYLIRGEAKEPRFGLEDEPKWWVKKAQKLPDGKRVLIKLVFLETFYAKIGPLTFKCFRSPEKEARILEKVNEHMGFMHGSSSTDSAGNNVRVLEIIPGKTLDQVVGKLNLNHEQYFYEYFPDLFEKYVLALENMIYLHDLGELHGDIRRDHLILDKNTGRLRWIDFDYTYDHTRVNRFAYDLFGLGNILIYLVGGGVWTLNDLNRAGYGKRAEKVKPDDKNIVFANYVANMKKVFPYVPEILNLACLHFSAGAKLFYHNGRELLEDLNDVREFMNF